MPRRVFHAFPFLFACIALPAGAGEVFVDPRVASDFKDFHAGLRMGGEGELGGLRLSLFLDAEFTPLPEGTRYNLMETDMREAPGSDVYFLGPGAALALPIHPAVFLTCALGVAQGFNCADATGWSGWTDAGLRFPVGELCHVGLVWQHRPLPGMADDRLALQFRFRPG
jgi:hypothetical protein